MSFFDDLFDKFPQEKNWANSSRTVQSFVPERKPPIFPEPEVRTPLTNFVESFIDNVIRDTVATPAIGSVVYCDLLLDMFTDIKHTGIYIGAGQIVHLNGDGEIEVVSPQQFLKRLDGRNPAISVYTSCRRGARPHGLEGAARRARQAIGERRDYSLFSRNCHQFTAGCLTGDFNNHYTRFELLRHLAENAFNMEEWRVWDFGV